MSVTFTYGATSVVLPKPSLGDALQHNIKTRMLLTMSGRAFTYKFTPVTNKFVFNFNGLTETDLTNLKAFIVASDGEEVVYLKSAADSAAVNELAGYPIDATAITFDGASTTPTVGAECTIAGDSTTQEITKVTTTVITISPGLAHAVSNNAVITIEAGSSWNVRILNNPFEFETYGKNECGELKKLVLEFEGVIV